jgi:DNA-binding response OmpR family regulator
MPGSRSAKPTALVAEDDALISLALEDALLEEGYRVIRARTVAQALTAIATEPLAMALVDYWLGKESADMIVDALKVRDIAFAICTGAVREEVMQRFPGALVIAKPFALGDIEALTRLSHQRPYR